MALKSIWKRFMDMLRGATAFFMRLFGAELSDKAWETIEQFIKFGLVGAMNTVVDYVTYLVTLFAFTRLQLFGDKAYLVSTVLGFIVSFFNMFFWNNRYVFKKGEDEERSLIASFIKLFISYSVTGIVIRPACMFILVDLIRFPQAIAPIPIMLVTIPLNFILSKLWAFRGKKTNRSEADNE